LYAVNLYHFHSATEAKYHTTYRLGFFPYLFTAVYLFTLGRVSTRN